jgi:predicted DNA-binding mobile mystery protein A
MNKSTAVAAKARVRLDPRLNEVRGVRSQLARPNQGWIRAIRQALGMTTRQLAHRMGIAQGTLTGLEVSEISGSIRLDTLQKAAAAMNCSLVYAFIPKAPLEEIVQEQARKVASRQLSPVEHSMLLENQALDSHARDAFLKNYIKNELDLSKIWQ